MKTANIRQLFLNFFANNKHTIVESSSIVGPDDDPTIMWTNAGMLQFKDVFLGKDKRNYIRATSIQKCLRAGGKHNDLDQVGFTTRHHTFFEMLGNFSFGDYFKKDAIQYAWHFLTGPRNKGNLALDPSKLWVTIFEGSKDIPADIEAEQAWINIGFPKERIMRFGMKDNFWQMGEIGPCGPCSEIHYDRGIIYEGDAVPNGKGDRVVEIWNLVFMQYYRNLYGKMTLLPKPSVDTGMGLERIAAILQNTKSNYEIDIFLPIFDAIWQKTNIDVKEREKKENIIASRVIADHIRAATFMINDGILPSNEGRGYVLRKIIRRALRFGRKLNICNTFFADLSTSVISTMSNIYKDLLVNHQNITTIIRREEEQFATTLDLGLKQLESLDKSMGIISGPEAFRLYDTFGFPIDLINDWCNEHNLSCDMNSFRIELSKQSSKGRSKSKIYNDDFNNELHTLVNIPPTTFTGYDTLETNSRILALFDTKYKRVQTLHDNGFLVLDSTPFYAQSGGQVGDIGIILVNDIFIQVTNCTLTTSKQHLHHITISSKKSINEQDIAKAIVNHERRSRIQVHHTSTHILHYALKTLLGSYVKQSGSEVNNERLRLDFNWFTQLDQTQIANIEALVNEQITHTLPVTTKEMTLKNALASKATAIFNEKYGDIVKVVSINNSSIELCGGTHVANTGNIGVFKIINETAVSAGIRRIEAVAGKAALEYIQNNELILTNLCRHANNTRDHLVKYYQSKEEYIQQLEKEIQHLQIRTLDSATDNKQIEIINDITLVIITLDKINNKLMRHIMDKNKAQYNHSIIIIISHIEKDKLTVLINVDLNIIDRINALEVFNIISCYINGNGGGKKHLVQGGGTLPSGIPFALNTLRNKLLSI